MSRFMSPTPMLEMVLALVLVLKLVQQESLLLISAVGFRAGFKVTMEILAAAYSRFETGIWKLEIAFM